ncbi:MAG: CopG family ribbon-helix-helix protein [Pseudomonadales bacterium]
MAKSTLGVRLNEDIQQRLEALGKVRERSPHYLMKTAIQRYLEVEEALEAERELVKTRWKQYELTGESLDHSEVQDWAKKLASNNTNAR